MRRLLLCLASASIVFGTSFPMVASAAVPDVITHTATTAPSTTAPSTTAPSTTVSWGGGGQGQLGNGTLTSSNSPTAVVGSPGSSATTAVSAGPDHACSVSDGKAYCWGRNDYGQLGNAQTAQSNIPVAVFAGGVLAGRTVTAISAGGFHTCAVADGLVFCWGDGSRGQLGNGLTGPSASSLVPVQVGGLGVTATEISTGHYRSCVLAGAVYCWGTNEYGQLGQAGTVTQLSVPVAVSGLPGGTLSNITGGQMFTCLLASGVPWCWGAGFDGQLGNGTLTSTNPTPHAVVTNGAIGGQAVTSLSAGQIHVCAVAAGRPYCWGGNGPGQLGSGTLNQRSTTPVAVVTTGALLGHTSTAVAAGGNHSCVLADGAPYCWGSTTNGQLGDGDTSTASSRPTPVASLTSDVLAGRTVTALSAGWGSTIGIAGPREPGSFRTVAPFRLLDTRAAVGITTRVPVAAGGSVAVQVTGRGGVPLAGVKAAGLTVTVTASQHAGYLTAYADGTTRPTSSNLNFVGGQTLANSVIVPIGANGRVRLYNGSGGTVHLIVDAAGYFFAGEPVAAGSFGALTPQRILDTRTSTAIAGRTSRILTTSGTGGVPAGSQIPVVLNVTVTRPAAGGYLTVYCDGSVRPAVSSVNFRPGQTVANLVVTPACIGGKVALYNGSGGHIDVLADAFGYFRPGLATARGSYQPLTPVRLLDTRPGTPLAAQASAALPVTGRGGIPLTGASSVLITVTALGGSSAGYVTVYGGGGARPLASQLNFPAGGTVANLLVAPIGALGRVALFNGSSAGIDLLADAVGYFRAN